MRRTPGLITPLLAAAAFAVPSTAAPGDDACFGPRNTIGRNFEGAVSVYGADVDGDGDIDVIGASHFISEVRWWENTAGDGTVWTEYTVDDFFDGAVTIYAADIDGDGDIDILGAADDAHDIVWWENTAGDGTVWSKHPIDGAFGFAQSVFAADVDGDGDLDVLGTGTDVQDVTWWENTTGDGMVWTEHTVSGSFEGASVYAADVDGDGDMDVLGAAREDDQIKWWRNVTGDGTVWSEHTVDDFFNGAHAVYAADVDGDGDIDVLGAADQADNITWWANAMGDGTVWIKHAVHGNFDSAKSVYGADVDGDGDIDILGAAEHDDDMTWWENTAGDGTDWIEHTVDGNFDQAFAVHTADIDGDGEMDILGAALGDAEIAWWENLGCTHDLNCNAHVGAGDLVILLGAWGTDPGGSPDFDGDGNVGTADLIELLGAWGPCP